ESPADGDTSREGGDCFIVRQLPDAFNPLLESHPAIDDNQGCERLAQKSSDEAFTLQSAATECPFGMRRRGFAVTPPQASLAMITRVNALLLLILLLPAPAFAQKEAVVIFKDGYYVAGKVTQPKSFILDPSGTSFTTPAPGSLMYVDDGVRRIFFAPAQVQDVLDKKG